MHEFHTSDVFGHISQITLYYLKLYFGVCFLVSSFNISKTPFIRTPVYDASLSLIEKDSAATTQDSFKDCILACKITNRMTRSLIFRLMPLIYLIYIKNIYNISLIIQSALSGKNNKCLYELNVINNVSLKFKISDTLRRELKVSYKGVIKSIVLLH